MLHEWPLLTLKYAAIRFHRLNCMPHTLRNIHTYMPIVQRQYSDPSHIVEIDVNLPPLIHHLIEYYLVVHNVLFLIVQHISVITHLYL